MATKKNNPQEEQQAQAVETAVSGVEEFLKKNGKIIETVVIAVVVIVCAGLALNKWYLTPAKEEAKGQMFSAEQLFRAGNFETALNGDGNILGFNDVISQFGKKAGKAVYFYAGICNLQTGNNEEAIALLKKYKTSDKIMQGRAYCCIGDAYANMEDNTTAISWYKKAAALATNDFTPGYLLKAGITSEAAGDTKSALKFYEEIKDQFPQTMEGYDIDKYISRIKNQE